MNQSQYEEQLKRVGQYEKLSNSIDRLEEEREIFKQKMIEISMMDDTQYRHEAGDSLMQKVLTQLGYGAGAEVFEEFDKWYA